MTGLCPKGTQCAEPSLCHVTSEPGVCDCWCVVLSLLPAQVSGDDLAQRLAAADLDQDVGDALLVQLARTSAYDTPGGPSETMPDGGSPVYGGSPTHSRSRAQLADADGGYAEGMACLSTMVL